MSSDAGTTFALAHETSWTWYTWPYCFVIVCILLQLTMSGCYDPNYYQHLATHNSYKASPLPLPPHGFPRNVDDYSDLLRPGKVYCAGRYPEKCCAGRNDECTAPILDTVCYCDVFCNRSVTDCCPDFWGHCMGIRPPPGAMTPPGPAADDAGLELVGSKTESYITSTTQSTITQKPFISKS